MEIGGDIAGLHTLGRTLTGVAPDVRGSTDYLFKRVDDLIGDAGWNGDAAESFKGAWEQDGTATYDLSDMLALAGQAITQLAEDLQKAQTQLDGYVETAAKAGVGFNDGGPSPGPYTEPAYSAAKKFQTDSQQAFNAAESARQTAAETLHTLLSAINPDVASDGEGTGIADLAAIGAVLKGYYVIPSGRVERINGEIAKANAEYKAARYQRKHTPRANGERAKLTAQLKDMRAKRAGLALDLDRAESLADKFKGGELLDSSLADTFRSLGGELEEDSKLSRTLDGIPGLDFGLAGLATWAQMKDDHEKGWTWTHALLADGGANAAALGAGIATDFIPVAGPFLSPVVSYGVGAIVTEATHEGHWTEHIAKDGVAMGTLEGTGDTFKAVWDTDVKGMGEKIEYDALHPVDAAKGVWHGVTNLF